MLKIKNYEFNLCYYYIKKEYGKLEKIFEFNCCFSILKAIQRLNLCEEIKDFRSFGKRKTR